MLVVTDEPNLDNMGALGALDYCVGKDVWQTMATGEREVTVPRSLRFVLNGELREGVTAWDIGQTIRHNQGGFGGVGKFIDFQVIKKMAEFDGPGLASLGIDGRMDLLAMYPIGMGIMNPDDAALEWAREHGAPIDGAVRSDADATYEATFDYDLGALEPKVSPPPSVRNAVDVGAIDNIRIDQAVVGSCDNGRMDDLRAVANVLRGRKIKAGVRMFVSPITQKVFQQAAREGLLEIFSEAGAIVESPGCGTCWGYVGQLAEGENCVSTTQHNYPGRMGSSKASIFLASAYTVAASALEGRIVDPRPYLQSQ
jgi:3-isopropylmalate/(R)-2-methylmalate dehydratase large subunit